MQAVRVRTLGSPVVSVNGQEISSLPVQRLRCAVLVYLSVEVETTREGVLATFWPDRPPDRARHAFSQTVYELRRLLGDDWLEIQGERLRVQGVQVDALELEAAVAAADVQKAVELYAGPFMEGFVLDSKPFESWMERRRAHLGRAHRKACRQWLNQLVQSGDLPATLQASRRWAEMDPLDDEAQHRYLEALALAGHRAEALRLYAEYERTLAEELGVEPLDETKALIARLRAGELEGAGVVPVRSPDPAPAETATSPVGESATRAAAPLSSEGLGVRPDDGVPIAAGRRDRRSGSMARALVRVPVWLRVAAAVLGTAAVVAAAAYVRGESGFPRGSMGVLVLPVTGTEVGNGLVGHAWDDRLIVGALEQFPAIAARTADAASGSSDGWTGAPLAATVQRARKLGARYVVAAELLTDREWVRVAARLYLAGQADRPIYIASDGGPRESIPDGLDRVAYEVATEIARREHLDLGWKGELGSVTSSSTARLALLRGQRRFFAGDADGAVQAYREAIAADSGCAPAYLRLSVAETWDPRWDNPAALAAVRTGLRFRDRMSPEWVRLLQAQEAFVLRDVTNAQRLFGQLSNEGSAPIDAWLGLAESLWYAGIKGRSPTDALPAYARVVSLDSTFAPIYDRLADLEIRLGNPRAAQSYAARIAAPDQRLARVAAIALLYGSSEARHAALAALDSAGRESISMATLLLAHQPTGLRSLDTLSGLLLGASRAPDDRIRGADYRLIAGAAGGHWQRALQDWDEVAGDQTFDKWLVHATLAGYPSGERGRRMLAWARARTDTILDQGIPPGDPATTRDPIRATVHALFMAGSMTDVDRLGARLRMTALSADPSNPEPGALVDILLARKALLQSDTAGALSLLEHSMLRAPWWISPFSPLADAAPERLALAHLWRLRGDTVRANAWSRSFRLNWSVGDAAYAPLVGGR